MLLTPHQEQILQQHLTGSIFLEGPPGCGKSTAAVHRLLAMIKAGVPAESILILTPQRTLAARYYQALRDPSLPAGGLTSILTLGGLAQRSVHLFWPLISAQAGFYQPQQPPTFLTLETAQYFMARVASPYLEKGYFEQLTIDRNRLYSQVLDNLNKAAVVGFAHTSISERLKGAWIGNPSQIIAYDQAQELANDFRVFCLQHNLLDYSLQIEVFLNHLWPSLLVRRYLKDRYRHLIYDNIEEDVPAAHDLLTEWLPDFQSALIITDSGGGNRIFLGADPNHALKLAEACQVHITMAETFVSSPQIRGFQNALESAIQRESLDLHSPTELQAAFTHSGVRFFTEMIDQACRQVVDLVHGRGVQPGEIAVLMPYLSDALRHALFTRLQAEQIPVRSLRPSRSLRDEPAARCLLTLARLAHPKWGMPVTKGEVRSMLLLAIDNLDLIRADLLVEILFRPRHDHGPLLEFDPLNAAMQERITFSVGERYTQLRAWLEAYREQQQEELDIFLARLFGELLSQPGFGFHHDFDAAAVTARLIESVQKFRRVAEPALMTAGTPSGKEYLQVLGEGVIAAQYLISYQQPVEAVLVAPAYTFIMANQPVSYQIWLDTGSLGWWERLFQPLTHPYVLSRSWQPGAPWTDKDEYNANQQALARLVRGLLQRCKQHVFLYTARINERGAEERGPLLQALQSILRRLYAPGGSRV